MSGFNLVDEPWLPCVGPNGTPEPVGLLDALGRAHEFRELRDGSPLVTVALHRLALAVLHRVFGPASPEEWSMLWKGRQFDAMKLGEYLKSSAVYPRFDIFDPDRPFYQTASLRDDWGVKPVGLMALELGYSDNLNLFSHFRGDEWCVRLPAEAARWLVALQSFGLGGMVTNEEGKKKEQGAADAGPLMKSAVVLARGENLFETLLLNLVHYCGDEEEPFRFDAEADRLAWERDAETRPEDRQYDGYLDLLTWQSRRIRLIPDYGPQGALRGVSGAVVMRGYQLPGFGRHKRETMAGFIMVDTPGRKQDPWPPLGFRPGRALWRESHALLQTVAEKTERPRTLTWVDELKQDGRLPREQVRLDVYGLSSSQAKVFFWRHESLLLPLIYLRDRALVGSLRTAIALAEQVGVALSVAVFCAAATALKPGREEARLKKQEREAVDKLARSLAADGHYWSELEGPFCRLVASLPGDDLHRADEVRTWFFDILRPTVRDAYRRTAGSLDYSSRALRASTAGAALLGRRLAEIARTHQFDMTTDRAEDDDAADGP